MLSVHCAVAQVYQCILHTPILREHLFTACPRPQDSSARRKLRPDLHFLARHAGHALAQHKGSSAPEREITFWRRRLAAASRSLHGTRKTMAIRWPSFAHTHTLALHIACNIQRAKVPDRFQVAFQQRDTHEEVACQKTTWRAGQTKGRASGWVCGHNALPQRGGG